MQKGMSRVKEASKVEFSALSFIGKAPEGTKGQISEDSEEIDKQIDNQLIRQSTPSLESKKSVRIEGTIKNTDRAFGTLLSSEIAKKYGALGLPDGTIHCQFKGSAGQSFGAFLAKGHPNEVTRS